MFSIKNLTLGAVCAIATASAVSAQHTVTINGNWVASLTIALVPQNNTTTNGVAPDIATVNARGNIFRVRVTGSAVMTSAATISASESAIGGAQGGAAYVGPLNGAVNAFGNTVTSGTFTAVGSTPGSNYNCVANYSNSLGQSPTAISRWAAGGLPVMTVPQNFGSPMALVPAVNFSWSSSNNCSITLSARGAGSSSSATALARINSTVTLF